MGKILRTILIVSLMLSFLAAIPNTPTQAKAVIDAGTWKGFFTRKAKVTLTESGVLIEASGSGKGNLTFNVSKDGTVTGKIENYQGEFEWKSSITPLNKCTFAESWDITGGTVKANPAGNPVFDLQLTLSGTPTANCNVAPPGGSATSKTNTAHFDSNTYSGGKITGTLVRFQTDMVDNLIASLSKLGGDMTVDDYWELIPTFSVPTIEEPQPEYKDYFLRGVTLQNTYWTSVSWNGTPEGKVYFVLEAPDADISMEAVPNELDQPSAKFWLMNLPPGKTTLRADAIGTDGEVKDSKSTYVTIVPIPAWAKNAGFDFVETKPYAIWKQAIYRGKVYVPEKPIMLPYLDLSSIPVIGTKWGLEKPFQVLVNLEATSKEGLSEPAKVTGEANFFLGNPDAPLKVTVDGQTVTNMTENALLFDNGQVNFKSNTVAFTHYIGLFSFVPALASVVDDPTLGKILALFDQLGCGVEVGINGKASGTGKLGVVSPNADQIVFTNGYIKPTVGFTSKVGCLFGLAPISVGGGGSGEYKLQIAPATGIEGCSFYIKFTATLLGATFPTPDYGVYACQKAMLEGQHIFAAYLPSDLVNQRLATSFHPMAQQVRLNSPTGQSSNSTILVSGASPDAALNLAAAPDGRMAFAYTTGKQGQVGVRVFDGQAWGEPVMVGDTDRVNMSPVVAIDGSGQTVVAWVRPAKGISPTLAEYSPYSRSWEIAYAVLDNNGKVITQESLTQDDKLDFFPELKRTINGTLWLVWLKSPSGDIFGSKDDPNWLQAASWNGKIWSSTDTISKEVLGSTGLRMAGGSSKDVSIVTSQDSDGNPETITDNEIYLYQHSGSTWSTQRSTNDQETDVFPLAAYTPEGQLVLAWKRGDNIVSLEGNLKAIPTVWNVGSADHMPTLYGAELLAGSDGELSFLWPSFTQNGQGVWLAHRPSAEAGWQPATALVDGLEGAGMISAQLALNGSLRVGLSQLHIPMQSQDVPGMGQVSIPGLPTSADLAVVEAAGVMQPVTAINANPDHPGVPVLNSLKMPSGYLLAGVAVLAVLIIAVFIILLARRSRS